MTQAWILELAAKEGDDKLLASIVATDADKAKIKTHLVVSRLGFLSMIADGMGLEGEQRKEAMLRLPALLMAELNITPTA